MKTIWVKKPDESIIEMDIEDYVKGVVPREVYDTWPIAVLDAQAIAARTYALATTKHANEAFDVCSTTCCQVYSDQRSKRCNDAVERTKGIVGLHKMRQVLVPMFFSACCGGQTRNTWDATYLRRTSCPCGQHTKNGHGQGMCQWGAYEMAAEKPYISWREILNHYYNLKWVDNYGEKEVIETSSTISEKLSRIEALLQEIRRELQK